MQVLDDYTRRNVEMYDCRPMPSRYSPLDYSINCKRNNGSGYSFIRDNVQEDLALILIAFATISWFALPVLAAIVLFHISFWIIYEIGYVENDRVAAKYEAAPKVPPAFDRFNAVFSEPLAWIYAIAVAIPAALIAAMSGASFFAGPVAVSAVQILALWTVLLLSLRLLYAVYNRVDKGTRVYLYLPLQVLKYGFPAVFFGLPAAGAALLFAQVFRRWVPYIIYRHSGDLPRHIPLRLLRLFVFVALWMFLLWDNWSMEYLIQGALALSYLVFRGWTQIREAAAGVQNVRSDKWQNRKPDDK